MERELRPSLYRLLRDVGKTHRQKYVQYPPWVVVAVFLWAALHDRPVSWACQRRHGSTTPCKPWPLPSRYTVGRRADRVGCGLVFRALERRLRDCGALHLRSFPDGKPLPIGGCGKDPDARFGRAAGCVAKGYKRHAVWASRPRPEAWEVAPMNVSEKVVGRRRIGERSHGGYLRADGNYDASALYDAAAARGYPLVAPYRPAARPGTGNGYQSPHRLRSIARMPSAFGNALYRARTGIERSFGGATGFGGGLGPLPAWVRGAERVRTWVWAKLVINALRIVRRQRLTTTFAPS